MKIVVSWLREFADVPPDPAAVAARLAAVGFAVESIEHDTIDFEVTANRPDAMSVIGLAREARTAFKNRTTGTPGTTGTSGAGTTGAAGAVHSSRTSSPASPDPTSVAVSIESPLCRRYALAMAEVAIGPSPAWLADRLTAAGVRPINNIVDVTNYVMLELGQPMHAFDAAKLAGTQLHARLARRGERLTTLDGEARTLDESMLVIADRDHAVAVAGVIGGRASEVSPTTTRIAIESATFDAASVRRTSKKLGLKTEASMRFERGADVGGPVAALDRALALIVQIGAGRPVGDVIDVYPAPPAPIVIGLTRAHLDRLLGAQVPDVDVERILTTLGFEVVPTRADWDVTVPTFRVDVRREADLIEEVARHWGFEHVPAALPPLDAAPPPPAFAVATRTRLTRLLSGAGLQEAVTFTFIERAAAEPFAGAGDLVAIANPLSEKFAVLRPSLLPGLVDALVYNRRRDADAVRFFEYGSVFGPSGESTAVGWVLTGPRFEHWSGNGQAADVFDAKGIAELVGRALGLTLDATPATDRPWFVRGRAAALVDGPRGIVGAIGQVRPDLVAARGLDGAVVVGGEILVREGAAIGAAAITPIPRMPSVVRDLSIVVSESLPAADVRATIWSDPPATLVDVREFDRYQGKGVPAGSVSLSLRLRFRDPRRTLTDSEVQHGVDRIVAALARRHGALVRGSVGPSAE